MLHLAEPAERTARRLSAAMSGGRALRVVNYHSTPRGRAPEYRAQVAGFARSFAGLGRAGLDALVDGRLDAVRPVLLPFLFEGFRNNRDVLLPILEAHGFTAWFFVPSAFLAVPAGAQRAYAARARLHHPTDDYPGERIALTWAEARAIADRGHVFACHSQSHAALDPDTPDAILRAEIVEAKAEMEAGLGRAVEIFCWLHGAETGVNPRADAMLRAAGFRYLVSNFRLQRLA